MNNVPSKIDLRRIWCAAGALLVWIFVCQLTYAIEAESADPSTDAKLSDSQQRLADNYDRLELLAGRLAELSRATQPRRAKLLRELVTKSREQDVSGQFEKIVAALQSDRLAMAVEGQGELQTDLQQLLDLLLQEDRDQQIEAERKRIAKYLADVKRLIRLQRGIKARTEGGDEQDQLTEDQQRTAQATGELSKQIKETEGSRKPSGSQDGKDPKDSKSSQGESSDGKPGEGKQSDGEQSEGRPGESSQGDPSSGQSSDSSSGESSSGEKSDGSQSQKPADQATKRLQQAQKKMQQAIEQLEKAKRKSATDEQEKALRELERAKAELERILRQLREEELERMLVLLEARFRKMLAAQIAVYEQTRSLDETRSNAKEHELEIASGRLSRKQQLIVHDADRALILLREDGTSVAFPEAVEQAREDMQAVANRLVEVKTSEITQALEEDIIAALEETLAAMQQAIKDLRKQKASQQSGGGEPGEQPLVDQLAELRMIRALQMRINRRTERYGNMIEGQQALEAELLEALDHLAEREERVYRATRDLNQGSNR